MLPRRAFNGARSVPAAGIHIMLFLLRVGTATCGSWLRPAALSSVFLWGLLIGAAPLIAGGIQGGGGAVGHRGSSSSSGGGNASAPGSGASASSASSGLSMAAAAAMLGGYMDDAGVLRGGGRLVTGLEVLASLRRVWDAILRVLFVGVISACVMAARGGDA